MNVSINVSEETMRFLKSVASRYLNDQVRLFVFGSRVNGRNRKYSDIDLGLISETEISPLLRLNLEEEFDNSNIPFRVDVVDFSKVTDNFKEVALKDVYYLN